MKPCFRPFIPFSDAPTQTGIRMLRPLVALLVAVLLAAFAGAAAAQAPVFPPGSRIGLVPPADMKLSRGLTGFRSESTGAAILALEMPPEAFPSLAASFTDSALKSQGFALKDREAPQVGGAQAIFVSGEQNDAGRAIPKIVLLAADPGMTALVIGQLPPGSSSEAVASVQAAIRTVAFRPPLTTAEQVASLPFKIGDMAGFRPIRAMAGNSLLLTDGASDVIREAAQPVIIVAQSFAPAPPPDRRDAFARQALTSNNFFKDTVVERAQGFRQRGQDWHEILAKAKDVNSDTDLIVMQTIRFEADNYVRSVGIARADSRDAVLPRFRRIVDSIADR